MIKLVIILSLISNICFAQNAVYLEKGQPAPFTGDLLTIETTKQLYNDSLEKSSLQKQLDLTTQNNNILMEQNTKLIKAGVEDHNLNNYEKAGYFLAGILVTGLAIKGVQALK